MHIWAKPSQENLLRMVRWMRWHCPPDTRFEIRALAIWGRARYLSITEASHNIEYLRVSGEETFFSSLASDGTMWQNSIEIENDISRKWWVSQACTIPLGHGGSPQYKMFTSERGWNILFVAGERQGLCDRKQWKLKLKYLGNCGCPKHNTSRSRRLPTI